ncbi:MAG: pilus assembly protein, partial [Rhizobacter sp.]
WVDVLEFQTFKANNQFLLAAKYGGFTVPTGYDPVGNTTPLPQAWWSTTGDLLPDGVTPRPDNYFTSARPDQMVAGLTTAFTRIAASLRSFTTSFSTSLPQVAVSGNASYSTQYDSSDWSGEIVANLLSFDPTDGTPSQSEAWRLTTKLATQFAGTGWNTGRRIATWNSSSNAAVPFRYASLSSSQQTALDTAYRTGSDGGEYLNYLRGDQTNELASTAPTSAHAYRSRTRLLGDIVGSKAEPVGPPSLLLAEATNPGYGAFKTTWQSRTSVVYVGANDGMMHAIDGSLTGGTAGNEIFAYVPSALYQGPNATPQVDGLAALGNPTFTHHFYVNASPTVYDINFGMTVGSSGTDWRSVLIGGLGKGGRAYYAIDVTNPAAMTSESAVAGKVLWEFTDPDMGYSYGDPAVVKTRKYGWVVIFVSGYNNADGKGYFFIVNPRTGQLLEKVSTGVGSVANSAGLATVNTFVLDRTDGTADAAYAGDLLGNVWRLDLTALSGSYPPPLLLAIVTDSSGAVQPITTAPLIEIQPRTRKRYVLFGTGRLLDPTDTGSTQGQDFYAILDGTNARFNSSGDLPTGVSFPLQRANLVANTDVLTGIGAPPALSMGWYTDMGAGPSSIGWRVLSTPTTFFGIIAWPSTLPSGDPCSPSGSSRIYAVDFGSGKTVLTNVADAAISYAAFAGSTTDLRFLSVGGKPRLIAGSDQGSLTSVRGSFGTGSGLQRLNWREVPVVD